MTSTCAQNINITTSRMKSIKRVLWLVLILNLVVALAKYLYGLYSNSASMQADGIHSIFDSAGNVIGIIGIALAARPADENHPYGHAKFETYASAAIGIMLLLAAFNVASSAISNLYYGNYEVNVSLISFVVMVGTLGINIGVTLYERRMGKTLKSEILSADASHTLSDALVSLGVVIGLALSYAGFPIADALMALVVSVAILFTAYDVFKHASATLSDHARIPSEDIRETVLSLSSVKNVHKIRSRGPEGEVYVDMHVLVDPDMTVIESHDLTRLVEQVLMKEYPQIAEVLVHIEPDDGHIDI